MKPNEKDKPNDKDKPNQMTLTVVVNGSPTEVTANVNAPVHTVIPEALRETNNTGQPPENWELRDEPGNLLDHRRKIGEFGFAAGTKLFLSLKAGIGG